MNRLFFGDNLGWLRDPRTRVPMIANYNVNIVLGNREEAVNDMYEVVIKHAHPDIDFTFSVAMTVPDFIAKAS